MWHVWMCYWMCLKRGSCLSTILCCRDLAQYLVLTAGFSSVHTGKDWEPWVYSREAWHHASPLTCEKLPGSYSLPYIIHCIKIFSCCFTVQCFSMLLRYGSWRHRFHYLLVLLCKRAIAEKHNAAWKILKRQHLLHCTRLPTTR